eukprot:2655586-Rhodomonas_salina.3
MKAAVLLRSRAPARGAPHEVTVYSETTGSRRSSYIAPKPSLDLNVVAVHGGDFAAGQAGAESRDGCPRHVGVIEIEGLQSAGA